jgi:hypothetical protein
MDAHQFGTALPRRPFQRLNCRARQCFMDPLYATQHHAWLFRDIPSFRSLCDGLHGWRSAN